MRMILIDIISARGTLKPNQSIGEQNFVDETPSARPIRLSKTAANTLSSAPARISSDSLFSGGNILLIEHNGIDYVLRKTRNGKLILTK